MSDSQRVAPAATVAPPRTTAMGGTANATSDAVHPGAAIAARYLIEERIGRGGTDDGYRAAAQLLRRLVAISVFRVDATPGDRRRIDGEMQTLAALRTLDSSRSSTRVR